MFSHTYRKMDLLWQKTEKFLIVFILSAMTLVTFFYTMFNNLYVPLYGLGGWFVDTAAGDFFDTIGDFIMDTATFFNWANEFTAICFAWLIFFCMSYGVRVGGHLGVDALIKLFDTRTRRILAFIGLSACLLYGGIMFEASLEWVYTFYKYGTLTNGLDRFGVARWHVTIIVPIGFLLFIIRYLEIGYRLITGQQDDLGLADEARDAVEELSTQRHANHTDVVMEKK
ncbi:TRAP transporter small permease [Oligella urethralis]|uniref:TRAP transporter small permease n=1 Tax=Oligella urethralis TaxID=90245 RepID=UPI000CFF9AD8|nr:TRAP transporter small permease [Oligella urethralis]AVL70660.1 TRAP transporter small permease [Oligella urethralis]